MPPATRPSLKLVLEQATLRRRNIGINACWMLGQSWPCLFVLFFKTGSKRSKKHKKPSAQEKGMDCQLTVVNQLFHAMGKLGDVDRLQELLESRKRHEREVTGSMYNALISAYAKRGGRDFDVFFFFFFHSPSGKRLIC